MDYLLMKYFGKLPVALAMGVYVLPCLICDEGDFVWTKVDDLPILSMKCLQVVYPAVL
jgi:hypothetical protein